MEKDELKSYKVKVHCKNCNWYGTQEIQKGVSVGSLDVKDCPICGCNKLESLGI